MPGADAGTVRGTGSGFSPSLVSAPRGTGQTGLAESCPKPETGDGPRLARCPARPPHHWGPPSARVLVLTMTMSALRPRLFFTRTP